MTLEPHSDERHYRDTGLALDTPPQLTYRTGVPRARQASADSLLLHLINDTYWILEMEAGQLELKRRKLSMRDTCSDTPQNTCCPVRPETPGDFPPICRPEVPSVVVGIPTRLRQWS